MKHEIHSRLMEIRSHRRQLMSLPVGALTKIHEHCYGVPPHHLVKHEIVAAILDHRYPTGGER